MNLLTVVLSLALASMAVAAFVYRLLWLSEKESRQVAENVNRWYLENAVRQIPSDDIENKTDRDTMTQTEKEMP